MTDLSPSACVRETTRGTSGPGDCIGVRTPGTIAVRICDSGHLGSMPFQHPLSAEQIIALVGDGVISTDAEGRILLFNRAAEEMFGYAADEVMGRDIEQLLPVRFRTEHTRQVREFGRESSPTRRAMAHRREVSGRRKNGEEFPAEATLSRQQMGTRTVLTVVVRDISERRAIEEEAERRGRALEASERRLRLALQSVGMGTWDWDPRANLVTWDEPQARLWGMSGSSALTKEQVIGRLSQSDQTHVEHWMEEALRLGHWEHEFRILLPNGAVRWLGTAGDVLRDAEGKPERLIGVTFDISERHEAEEQRRFLMAETRHRLQNLMSVVQAIVKLSGHGDGDLESYRRGLLGRLQSVAQTERLLMEEGAAADSLTELLRVELAHYKNTDGSNVILEGPPVHVSDDWGVPLGLAVHELATNAAKYGALTVPSGRVEVRWGVLKSEGQERLALDWREYGGPEVRTPTRRGFGTKVLERTLGRKAGASVRIDYNPSGLRCAIELPLLVDINRDLAPNIAPVLPAPSGASRKKSTSAGLSRRT